MGTSRAAGYIYRPPTPSVVNSHRSYSNASLSLGLGLIDVQLSFPFYNTTQFSSFVYGQSESFSDGTSTYASGVWLTISSF